MPMPRDYVFEPVGVNAQFFSCRDPEILNWGCAGSGKSITALNRLDFMCSKYSGIRCLIVRKTRASLTNSAMVSFEDKVLREGSAVLKDTLQRKNRTSYRYPNGSEIDLKGLDDPENVLSTEYDVIYIQECVQITENEYEMLLGRNRNNKMPYQCVIADTNPAAKTHWLRKRMDRDRLDIYGKPTGKKMITAFHSTHYDNPFYWDRKARSWTEAGLKYVTKLSNYTGIMRKRYFEGEWVSSEGTVYPEFDIQTHVVSRKNIPVIPAHWPRYMAIDWGYTNPCSIIVAAVDVDRLGAIYVFKEHYRSQMTVPEHAKIARKMMIGQPPPVAIICDHDAGDRAIFEAETGWTTIPAKKDKEINIQEVRLRLVPDEHGNCGLYFLDDMLLERDKTWEEDGNPVGMIEEFGAYSYRDKPDKVSAKEVPQDKWDHSMDCLSYLCRHVSNHHGEWKGLKGLPKFESKVATQNPLERSNATWNPFQMFGGGPSLPK